MITRVFSKSKPVNILLIILFIVLLFIFSNHQQLIASFSSASKALLRLALSIFLVLLLNFIVTRNKLTKKNNYAILVFALLLSMFPQTFTNTNLLLAATSIMLAMRRLLSLHTNKAIMKKLFDAGFWMAVATLFYFWSILFFALIIVALIYYSQNQVKNLIIPFVGFLCVLIILMSYNVLFHDVFIKPNDFVRLYSLEFAPFNTASGILKLTVVIVTLLWSLVYFFSHIQEKNKTIKPILFIMAWASILAVFVVIIAPFKNNGELIFLCVPLAVIMANYIQDIQDIWFKEVFIGLYVLTPILALFL